MAEKTFEFKMEMTCEGCASAAKKVLGKLGNVSNVVTNVEQQTVLVTSTNTSDDLLQALQKTGKSVSFVGAK